MLNILCIGVTILIILGVALLYHVWLKVTPEESWASAIMTILVLIYIAGLIGDTRYGLYVIYIGAVMGALAGIVALFRRQEYSLKTVFTPGILMMFGITAVGAVAFKGMHICNWDELYQWGKAANYMMEYNQFPSSSAFSGEAVLLSNTTFFHYFISKISAIVMGEITESNYYVSNLLLWFSALILPFSGAGWKEWKRVWGFGFFHFMLTALIFVQPYYNIYTDQPTAYWAGGVIAWLLLQKCNKRNVYLLPLILVNVGLMKSMVGPLFAVIVILAVVVLYCSMRSEQGKKILPENWRKILFSKKGMLGILAVLSPVLFMGIWSLVIKNNGLFRFNGGSAPGEKDRLTLTVKAMIKWIFESVTLKEDRLYLSYGIFILITVGLVCVVYPLIVDKEKLVRYQRLMYIYIIGFAGYFLVMLFAYMTVFGYVDSIQAKSLNRYYSDYMMLGVLPLTIVLFYHFHENGGKYTYMIKNGLIFAALICIVYGSSDYFLENLVHIYALDTKNYAEREQMIDYSEEVKELTNETGKIYFVNQNKSGLFTLVADYDMGDQLSRGGMCFHFRKDTSEPILGLTEYPIETLPQVLAEQDYNYLWVYSTNDYFEENMKELFGLKKVRKGNFYKVVKDGANVELEFMERIK